MHAKSNLYSKALDYNYFYHLETILIFRSLYISRTTYYYEYDFSSGDSTGGYAIKKNHIFQGFSNFWYPDYLRILKALTHFPHDLGDMYFSGQEYVFIKSHASPLQIDFLRADLAEQFLASDECQQTVVWSTELTVYATIAAIGDRTVTHISTAKRDEVITLLRLC